MRGALNRYRAIAYIVGVVLILLVVVGMPMKYLSVFGKNAVIVETVGPAHGFLYMLYLVAVFDLGRRAHWELGRMLKIMLAGTVPFVSFYAERAVVRWVGQPEEAPAPVH